MAEYTTLAAKSVVNAKTVDGRAWWLADDSQIFTAVHSAIQTLIGGSKSLRSYWLAFLNVYTGRGIAGMSPWEYNKTKRIGAVYGDENGISLNVVASCVDSVSSKLASNKPRVMFATVGGSYAQQKRAKQLTLYMDGLFDQLDIYELGAQAFVDSAIFGTGVLGVSIQNDRLVAERIFPHEILIDDVDAFTGRPTHIHRRRFLPKTRLLECYPDAADMIARSSAIATNNRTTSDLVEVVESWYVSASDVSKNRHVVTTDTGVLLDEEYPFADFPLVFLRWKALSVGFWGMGLAEELISIQQEINRLLAHIRQSQKLMSNPKMLVEVASNINVGTLNRDVGGIIKYSKTPPAFIVPPAQQPEIYDHLERLIQKAYEISGVSQLSATQQKPAGVESGVALRTLQDVESQRFQLCQQRYERFFVDLANRLVDLSDQLPDTAVFLTHKTGLARLKWSDVRVDREEFTLNTYPTNILPSTPAGKLQTVQDMLQAQMISPEIALDLLDMPDLDAAASSRNAGIENAKYVCEELSEGQYVPPSQFMNLGLAIQMVQSAYLNLQAEKADELILEYHRTFISQAQDIIKSSQTPTEIPQSSAVPPQAAPVPPTNQ